MDTLRRLRPGRYYGRTLREVPAGELLLTETEYAPRARIPRHEHDCAYVCFVRQGGFSERYGRRRRECGPQTLAFHPPGEEHLEHIHDTRVLSFNIELPPGWIERVTGVPDATGALAAFEDEPGGRLSWLAAALFREFRSPAPSPFVLEESIATLLAEAAGESAPRPGAGASSPGWLEDVRERVHEEFATPADLADLAATAGVHPVHLAQSFRRRFGVPVGEYRRRRQIGRACRALAGADDPLAEVGAAAGFFDQAHLTRTMKRYTGFTPARYRALFRES